MDNLRLSTVGAVCALVTVALFVIGIALMVTAGVQVLIPETGDGQGAKWIADVQDAGDGFYVGAWLVLFGGFTGLVALIGFYDALRGAGQVLVLGPVLGIVGMTLVTISHAIPVALAYELVPAYGDADPSTQASLLVTTHTLASVSLATNYLGNILGWGVVVPLYGIAILKTSVVPRWLGWLALVVGFFAGFLTLLSPASSVIEGLSTIGFFAFFIFLAAMGVALLRRRDALPAAAPSPI